MKISKVFTGLVVCGALILPGALNSTASAKEISNPVLLSSSEYPSNMPWSKYYPTYQGPTVPGVFSVTPGPPYAPIVYTGTLFYKGYTLNGHLYEGTLYKQN